MKIIFLDIFFFIVSFIAFYFLYTYLTVLKYFSSRFHNRMLNKFLLLERNFKFSIFALYVFLFTEWETQNTELYYKKKVVKCLLLSWNSRRRNASKLEKYCGRFIKVPMGQIWKKLGFETGRKCDTLYVNFNQKAQSSYQISTDSRFFFSFFSKIINLCFHFKI